MQLKMKLLALSGLSLALVVTAACMGGDKKMSKEARDAYCKDIIVHCEELNSATNYDEGHGYEQGGSGNWGVDGARKNQMMCAYKCRENTETSTGTETSTVTNTTTATVTQTVTNSTTATSTSTANPTVD